MARPIELEPEELASLGKEIWRPSFSQGQTASRPVPLYRRRPVVATLAIALASMVWGLSLLQRGSQESAFFIGVGSIFTVACWVLMIVYGSTRLAVPPLAVYEQGVLVPKTFQRVPGLERVGGPMAFRRSEIRGALRVEEGSELGLLLATNLGTNGLVDRSARRPELRPDELRATIDGMCDALEKIGLKVTRGGLDALTPASAEAVDSAPEESA